MTELKSPQAVVDALEALYQASVQTLSEDLQRFVHDGTIPPDARREERAWSYPELRVRYEPEAPPPPFSRAFGKFSVAGVYATTVTRPAFFRTYLIEQLATLMRDYDVTVEVEASDAEIPYAYVWDRSSAAGLEDLSPAEIARWFPAPDLLHIGDEIGDGEAQLPDGRRPLALFDGPRVDFSLGRLAHYCGTPVEAFQKYVLFTNYHRYVDAFCEWALTQIGADGPYDSLHVAGGIELTEARDGALEEIQAAPWRRYQMPAYHLAREGGGGITLVNIGVGPSNAKTITDHLAVLRPECWVMVGHCGGLRQSQAIGDYVLAHAYLREDHVLDAVLSPEFPVPALAEIQTALQEAAAEVTGETGAALKRRLRTGTVVTTDDRNWELRYTESAKRFNKSRAVAIDMESATIAANGFRLRVPYGVLLCVSDKPLHGEIKLPGAANRFYERAIGEHIRIGIQTLERLAADKDTKLHSRKLRSFDEPPFR
ncbi:MAG: AMP nucleosidase [Planctomycetota bacterium]